MSNQDPIVTAALKAVSEFSGGRIHETRKSDYQPGGVPLPSAQASGGILTPTLKGTGYLGSDSEPAGSALNPQGMLGLFAKIRRSSSWMRFVSFAPVSETTGNLDLWDDRSFKMHPTAAEGPRTGIPLHTADVSQNNYATRTISGAFGIRLKAAKATARAGQNVNELIRRGVAAGVADVLADIGINGDTTLPLDTSENIMRSAQDGWFKDIRDNGDNYNSVADGFSYHNAIWAGMLQQIDEGYRADKGLAWMSPDVLGTRWLVELTASARTTPSDAHPSMINDFGAQLLSAMGQSANPLGKPMIVTPQIETDHYGTEGYAGLAPTSVVDNGNGTLTINVNTLAGSGVDRSSTGADGQRYVTVGCVSTGVEETLPCSYSAPNNTVLTTSLLGQTVASAVAADYYVKWADLTSLFLGLPRYLVCVVQNGIRIYTVFYPRDEVIEVIVHADVDYLVVDHDGCSLTDDIIAPRYNVIPGT